MARTAYTFYIDQGATFNAAVVWKDGDTVKDLTGYTARMQIRPTYAAVAATESLTTETGEITIIPADGQILLNLSATRTAAIRVDVRGSGKPPKTTYVYDLELIDADDNCTRLLFGDVVVYAEVTR